MGFVVEEADFFSRKTRCAGRLYLPEGVKSTSGKKPPVVIMAHGFAAEMSFKLPAFAERFVKQGLAVFLFDYRNFGESDGTPRNLVSHGRHLEDWKAAIAHVRGMENVDTSRIALWGSSFGGGHVIVTAPRDRNISAVVSQVPFVDGIASAKTLGLKYIAKATIAGLIDLLRMITGRRPYNIPVVGKPDTFAVMNTPGAYSGYMALVPDDSRWKNECPARIMLTVTMYRPIKSASKVRCPLLIVMAEDDNLIPARVVRKMAYKAPDAELVGLPVGHFDVYAGDVFEDVVKREADFLVRHLKV